MSWDLNSSVLVKSKKSNGFSVQWWGGDTVMNTGEETIWEANETDYR